MKTVSNIVQLVREWPSDVMRKKRGYRHDEVWNSVDVDEVVDELQKTTRHADTDREILRTYVDPSTREHVGGKMTEFSFTWPDGRFRHFRCGEDGVWRKLYLRRRVLYVTIPWMGTFTLRLHTFYRGDDDSAPHDHPWWFVTFPLTTYTEEVEDVDWSAPGIVAKFRRTLRTVRAFRFHFRPATYRHIVQEPERPFHTIVVSGDRERKWGFWPTPTEFVPYNDWAKYQGDKK